VSKLTGLAGLIVVSRSSVTGVGNLLNIDRLWRLTVVRRLARLFISHEAPHNISQLAIATSGYVAMRCLLLTLAVVALPSIFAQSQSDPTKGLHLACYQAVGSNTIYTISAQLDGVTVTRSDPGKQESYPAFVELTARPAWPDGVAFAEALRADGLLPLPENVTTATWGYSASTRVDTLTFKDTAGNTAVFVSTACPGWNNCPYRSGIMRHCWDDLETCCGAGSINPQCILNDADLQCCTWEASAATCAAGSTCCGGFGPGTSSFTTCCDGDATCCPAAVPTDGAGECCPRDTTCCRGKYGGLCCASNELCDAVNDQCVPNPNAPATPSPPTAAVTPSPTDSNEQDPDGPNSTVTLTGPLVKAILLVVGEGNAFDTIRRNPTPWSQFVVALRSDLAMAVGVLLANVSITSSAANEEGLRLNVTLSAADDLGAQQVASVINTLPTTESDRWLPLASDEYRKTVPTAGPLSIAEAEAAAATVPSMSPPGSGASPASHSLWWLAAYVILAMALAQTHC
jgi:hypothetical protein